MSAKTKELVLTAPETGDRSTGIGASEVSALVGMHPRLTAFDLWILKKKLLEGAPATEVMDTGNFLQRPIAELYQERTGKRLTLLFDQLIRHPERPWQFASPDALDEPEREVDEIKNVGPGQARRWGEAGSDEVPDEVICQVTWQISTLGYERGRAVALINGHRLAHYPIPFDRDIENHLLEAADRFMRQNLQADIPPPATNSETAQRLLRRVFPRDVSAIRPAIEEEVELIGLLHKIKRMEAKCTGVKENLELALRAAIGNSAGIEAPGLPTITWKRTKDSLKTDWEAVAQEALGCLQLIASAKGASEEDARTVAAGAVSGLMEKYTHVKPGYRRFLAPVPEEEE
jgi:putative phage-type endonuclease